MRPLGVQISRGLAARGVEVVFGIPGVHNQELYRGIEEAGITHVLARHEQGAGFMADGYARATGRPGVAYVITGPGLTNILTPMGQAFSDSVPMLVISSCLAETAAIRGQLHQMRDQEEAARTVAAASDTARSPEAVWTLIDRAFSAFAVARPRPRHVSVPIPVLEAPASDAPPPPDRPQGPGAGARAALAEAARRLCQARRPLVIAGGGARRADIARLLERTGAAAFTTYAGRGVVPPAHPLLFGSMLARPGSAEVLARADLVLAIGTELSETDLWRDLPGHTCPMIRVDIDPEVVADRQRAALGIVADAERFVADLCEALAGHAPGTEWTAEEVAETRARWRAEIDAERPGILPVVEALRSALPPRTMIYSDMTQFAYAAKELWDMPAPGLWHHPTGFGTLGYALPAAIGGKVGVGEGRPVVAIAGDYGFQYTVQELATAVELGLSLPIIVWDNGKLGEIEESMVRAQIAPNAVTVCNPDFAALGRAYGAAAARPADLDELAAEVAAALGRPGPTLIHVDAGIAL